MITTSRWVRDTAACGATRSLRHSQVAIQSHHAAVSDSQGQGHTIQVSARSTSQICTPPPAVPVASACGRPGAPPAPTKPSVGVRYDARRQLPGLIHPPIVMNHPPATRVIHARSAFASTSTTANPEVTSPNRTRAVPAASDRCAVDPRCQTRGLALAPPVFSSVKTTDDRAPDPPGVGVTSVAAGRPRPRWDGSDRSSCPDCDRFADGGRLLGKVNRQLPPLLRLRGSSVRGLVVFQARDQVGQNGGIGLQRGVVALAAKSPRNVFGFNGSIGVAGASCGTVPSPLSPCGGNQLAGLVSRVSFPSDHCIPESVGCPDPDDRGRKIRVLDVIVDLLAFCSMACPVRIRSRVEGDGRIE